MIRISTDLTMLRELSICAPSKFMVVVDCRFGGVSVAFWVTLVCGHLRRETSVIRAVKCHVKSSLSTSSPCYSHSSPKDW